MTRQYSKFSYLRQAKRINTSFKRTIELKKQIDRKTRTERIIHRELKSRTILIEKSLNTLKKQHTLLKIWNKSLLRRINRLRQWRAHLLNHLNSLFATIFHMIAKLKIKVGVAHVQLDPIV
jgi:recombinational DNA repair ATPase RecF